MLDWMRRFHRKYSDNISEDSLHRQDSEENSKNDIPQFDHSRRLGQVEDKNPQTTLDNFVKKSDKSLIYDENFGIEDLRLLTRRWREQNLAVE